MTSQGEDDDGKRRMAVRSGLKGGRIAANHNGTVLAVRSGLKGGRLAINHNGAALKVRGGRGIA